MLYLNETKNYQHHKPKREREKEASKQTSTQNRLTFTNYILNIHMH